MISNKWRIEGDFLVRDRGGLGNYDPIAIYDRIINLRKEKKFSRTQARKLRSSHMTLKRNIYKRVAWEFGLELESVMIAWQCVSSNRKEDLETA